MTIEAVSFPTDLNASYPATGDPRSEGDDHIRNIKTAIKNAFPGLSTRAFSVSGGLSGAQSPTYTTGNTVIYAFSGNGTANLPAAASVGNGFMIGVYAPSGVSVTVDPNSSELVNGSGTITVTGGLAILFCTGTGWLAAVTFSASDPRLLGEIIAYAGATAPTGWLWCDGSAVSRSTYAALFAIVGTAFGAGDGSTTFNLPDLRGRLPVGKDNMDNSVGTGGGDAARTTTGASGVDGDTLGAAGGAETVTLAIGQVPSHDHGGSVNLGGVTAASSGAHTHVLNGGFGASSPALTAIDGFNVYDSLIASAAETASSGAHTHSLSGTAVIASQGGGGAHNNMPPVQVVNYIIKAA